MELQLTKTKTITIGGGSRRRKSVDIVGLDLFSGDPRGCPAVRLVEKKGVLRVVAVGFVPTPLNDLPASWEEASRSCSWSLPTPFQAPRAALAVTSPEMFFAQTTMDAFRSDFSSGAHRAKDESAAKPKKLGIRREQKSAVAAAEPTGAAPLPEVTPGNPVSNGGTRFVMKSMPAAEGFVMEAGLPEYQILWVSRLLPEGRRPTAASVQVRPSALSASLLRQPEFSAADGSALALFVADDAISIAGYKGGDIVLWRTCHDVPGWKAIKAAIQKGLGLEEEMISGVLEDKLIDPRPVLEPLIAPIVDELAVSRDYLVGKLGIELKKTLLFGVPAGAKLWQEIAEDRAHLKLDVPNPFDGIEKDPKAFVGDGADLNGPGAYAFIGAIGAALALVGEEAAQ